MSMRTSRAQSRIELEQDPELEAVGLGLAPGLPGVERSEAVGNPAAGGADPGQGGRGLAPELVDDALDRARVRTVVGELPGAGVPQMMGRRLRSHCGRSIAPSSAVDLAWLRSKSRNAEMAHLRA